MKEGKSRKRKRSKHGKPRNQHKPLPSNNAGQFHRQEEPEPKNPSSSKKPKSSSFLDKVLLCPCDCARKQTHLGWIKLGNFLLNSNCCTYADASEVIRGTFPHA